MTLLAQITFILFVVVWFLAVGTWFHGTWHWLKFMNARRSGVPFQLERRLAMKSYLVFASLILLGFALGAIGNFVGGGWK